ncbi:unnamed protein product [Discosporangium mesarthrocarpum]
MLSDHLQGELLKLLTRISGARRVLDIGTFAGYSALAFAEALPEDGVVVTLEVDKKTAETATEHFRRSTHGHKISLMHGPAIDSLNKLIDTGAPQFDLIFIDADKMGYQKYYDKVMATTATQGGEKPMLSPHGLLVADNVLFHSLVPLAEAVEDNLQHQEVSPEQARALLPSGRHRKIAQALNGFNKKLRSDPRVEVVMLTMRDGLSVVRWRDSNN